MLGKTHLAAGIAAGLAIMQPATIPELIVGAGASAIGAVISDIDVDSSESRKEMEKLITAVCVAVTLIIAAEAHFHLGIYERLMQNSSMHRIIIGITGFLLICIFGKEQPHRSFMHSILALLLLTTCMEIFFPLAAPYFAVAFTSHLVLDLLNKKKERIFWPARKGICLGLFSSRGLINKCIWSMGNICTIGEIWLLLERIYLNSR